MKLLSILLFAALSVYSLQVNMTVKDPNTAARVNEPLTCGVPLTEGAYFDPSVFQVRSGTTPVPGECGVLNRWADSSIKWLRVNFSADIGLNSAAIYTLADAGGAVAHSAGALSIQENGNLITVNTGKITVTVNTTSFHLFDTVKIGTQVVVAASANDGGAILDSVGTYSTASHPCREVSWDERGIYRAVLKLRGWYTPAGANQYHYSYTARLYFTSGSDRVPVDISVENIQWLDSMRVYKMDHMGVLSSLAFTGTQYTLGGDNGAALTGSLSGTVVLDQPAWNVFTVTGGGSGSQAWGYADVSSGSVGVAVGVRQFWQQYPKTVRVSPGSIDVRLWTEQSQPRFLGYGAKKTYNMLYYFHTGSASSANVVNIMKGFNNVIVPRADYAWIAGTKAVLGLLSPRQVPVGDYGTGGYGNGDQICCGSTPGASFYGWTNWFCDSIHNGTGTLNQGGEHWNEYPKGFRYLLDGNYSQLTYNWAGARQLAEMRSNGDASSSIYWWWKEGDSMTVGPNGQFVQDRVYLNHYNDIWATASRDAMRTNFPGYDASQWWYGGPDCMHFGLWTVMEFYLLTGDYALRDAAIAQGQAMGFVTWLKVIHTGETVPREMGWAMFNLGNAYSITHQKNLKDMISLWSKYWKKQTDSVYCGYFNKDYTPQVPPEYGFQFAGNPDSLTMAFFQISMLDNGLFTAWEASHDQTCRDLVWASGILWRDLAQFDSSRGLYPYIYVKGGPQSIDLGFIPAQAYNMWFNLHPDLPHDWAYCYRLTGDRKLLARMKYLYRSSVSVGIRDSLSYANPGFYWSIFENRPDTVAPAAPQISADGAAGGIAITFPVPADASPLAEYAVKVNTIAMTDSAVDGVTRDYFWRGTSAASIPKPKTAGVETLYVTGLTPGATYHIAVKAYDSYGNLSPISNDVTAQAGVSGIEESFADNPVFSMEASPNPFNPAVKLNFKGSRAQLKGGLKVSIFNIDGRRVADLSEQIRLGNTVWKPEGLASGLYVIMARLGNQEIKKSVLLVK